MFNTAIITLHLFKIVLSSSSAKSIQLDAVVDASFAPLFIAPSSKFWRQISEMQLMSHDESHEDKVLSLSPSSTSVDTVTSLFMLSGICIHRGLRRSFDFLQAYRHTSPAAAQAAADVDDTLFRHPYIWNASAEWCQAFGAALHQQHAVEARVIARFPAWMVEVSVRRMRAWISSYAPARACVNFFCIRLCVLSLTMHCCDHLLPAPTIFLHHASIPKSSEYYTQPLNYRVF